MPINPNVGSRVRELANRIRSNPLEAAGIASKAVTTGTKVFNNFKTAFEDAGRIASQGFTAARRVTQTAAGLSIYNGGRLPSAFQRITGPLGVVGGVASFGKAVGTAISDVRNAVRTGSRSDIAQAASSTLSAVRSGVSTVQSGFKAWGAVQAGRAFHAAEAAFRAAAPGASATVSRAAAAAATRAAFVEVTGSTVQNVARQAVRAGVREAAQTAAQAGGQALRVGMGTTSRAAARAAVTAGSHAAIDAAARTSARAAASTVGRAAARFAPGVNVAMAAIDTGIAVATLADPNASTGRKVSSVITAAGSIVAATNIPVVSQVGAAVSVVSSFVGSFF